jgi:phosphatidylglycerophosphate synthase
LFDKLFRHIAKYISKFLIWTGTSSPNPILLIGTLLGLSGSILIAIGEYWWGVSFFIAYCIFDFCDGGIAKYYGQNNFMGKWIDGSRDLIIWSLFYSALVYWGIWVAFIYTFSLFLYERTNNYRRWIQIERGITIERSPNGVSRPLLAVADFKFLGLFVGWEEFFLEMVLLESLILIGYSVLMARQFRGIKKEC